MHDRTVSNRDDAALCVSSLRAVDVTERTHDPLARVEEHVDSATIARKLGTTPQFIRNEIARGVLPFVRLGRKRVVPISAVEAYVAARAVGNHPARKTTPTVVGLAPVRRRTA